MSFSQRTKNPPVSSLEPGDGSLTHSPLRTGSMCGCDQGTPPNPPPRSVLTLLETEQDEEEPSSESDSLQTAILSPPPCKHPQRQQ